MSLSSTQARFGSSLKKNKSTRGPRGRQLILSCDSKIKSRYNKNASNQCRCLSLFLLEKHLQVKNQRYLPQRYLQFLLPGFRSPTNRQCGPSFTTAGFLSHLSLVNQQIPSFSWVQDAHLRCRRIEQQSTAQSESDSDTCCHLAEKISGHSQLQCFCVGTNFKSLRSSHELTLSVVDNPFCFSFCQSSILVSLSS